MSNSTTSAAPLVRRFTRNTQGRDLIVGDVHGCFTKLQEDLAAVGFNQSAGDRLFSLGDLVDRGPESAKVLDLLGQPSVFAIRGNHEQMAIDYHRGAVSSALTGSVSAGLLVQNGGGWFVGMTPEERLPYADAFEALPVAIELETEAGLLGLVHAECPSPDWDRFTYRLGRGGEMAQHAMDMAQWSRGRVDGGICDDVAGVLAVLVGHTPVQNFTSLGNVFYCDSGAWLQGGAIGRRFTIIDASTMRPARAPSPLE